MTALTVCRVLSNNALLVSADADMNSANRVLVGKGIGFSKKPGDQVDPDLHSREYIELSEQHRLMLETLQSLDDNIIEVIIASIDLAMDLLGHLHPSVYVILAEHISFAVDRIARGEVIRNSLVAEIKAVAPEEFAAAELVVNYLNAHLESPELPIDEAAFVALHLQAARTGGSVKQPLAVANAISQAAAKARVLLEIHGDSDALSMELALLHRRIKHQRLRKNILQQQVEMLLPKEYQVASQLLADLLKTSSLPPEARGEASYLAVFLHGWIQETPR